MVLKKLLVSAMAAFSVFLLAVPAMADGPSYTDTVFFLRNKLRGPFEEQQNCTFSYINSEKQTWSQNSRLTFSAKRLETAPTELANDSVTFVCANGASCVIFNDMPMRSITLDGSAADMKPIAKAMAHLIELCQTAKPDLFQ